MKQQRRQAEMINNQQWNPGNQQAGSMPRAADVGGGVTVTPLPITRGAVTTVRYNGQLSKSGAGQVYLHLGYGAPNQWQQVRDIALTRSAAGWEATIRPDQPQLNFCFKDNAGNWDNNYRLNWSFQVHSGQQF
jgi:hypothetical protein